MFPKQLALAAQFIMAIHNLLGAVMTKTSVEDTQTSSSVIHL